MPRRLNADFERLVIEQRAYLEPHPTVTEVARRLRTNKTYISRLVNEVYGMSFSDLVHSLRARYARQYQAEHPGARQEEVAAACGYASVYSFNRSFKKATGLTPREAMMRNAL